MKIQNLLPQTVVNGTNRGAKHEIEAARLGQVI